MGGYICQIRRSTLRCHQNSSYVKDETLQINASSKEGQEICKYYCMFSNYNVMILLGVLVYVIYKTFLLVS